MASEYRLTIPGDISEVPDACNWVVQLAENAGLDPRAVNHCELAVDEAVTNIIEHGYGGRGQNEVVDIIVRHDDEQFTITIVDDSPPFNPLNSRDPDPLAALDDRPERGGGWGVFFIKKIMDDVDYEYAANRNHLIMSKRAS